MIYMDIFKEMSACRAFLEDLVTQGLRLSLQWLPMG